MKTAAYFSFDKPLAENMGKKISDQNVSGDMEGLLRPDLSYNITEAYDFVKTELLGKI